MRAWTLVVNSRDGLSNDLPFHYRFQNHLPLYYGALLNLVLNKRGLHVVLRRGRVDLSLSIVRVMI